MLRFIRKHWGLCLLLAAISLLLLSAGWYAIYSYVYRQGGPAKGPPLNLSFPGEIVSSLRKRRSAKYARGVADALTELLKFNRKLEELGEKYPDDAEIQLGLSLLLRNSGRGAHATGFFTEDHRKALPDKFPENRPIWAHVTNSVHLSGAPEQSHLLKCLHELRRRIDTARGQDLTQFKLHPAGLLYHQFKNGGKGVRIDKGEKGKATITVTDFDLAGGQLKEWIDQRTGDETAKVLAVLDRGGAVDPDNALYNYLKARYYFSLDDSDKSIEQIEEGVRKKYLSNYLDELSKAMRRVLGEVEFPMNKLRYLDRHIDNAYSLCEGIHRRYLADLADSCEDRGDYAGAEKIYELTIGMAGQITEDPIPALSLADNGEHLEKWAKRRIKKLRKKMQNPENLSGPAEPITGGP